MHVLIADDDPVYRELMSDLMGQWGFDLTVVENGREALKAVEAGPPPSVAVLDWMMPELDGFEACRRLKEGRASDIHVVMVTGSVARQDMIKVLVAGADDYLVKPFQPIDLQMRMRTAKTIVELREDVSRLRSRLAG